MKTKNDLKLKLRKEQKKKCAISGKKLKKEPLTFDSGRIRSKSEGGLLKKNNVRALNAVANMKLHDNFRKRSPELTELKIKIDAREQVRKLLNACNSRLDAALKRKTDQMDPDTKLWLEETISIAEKKLGNIDRRIFKQVRSLSSEMPIIKSALAIRGVGATSIAYLLVYVKITEAEYASSLWSYIGYDKASWERYKKGQPGGGNKTLRTAMYALGESMVKTRAIYREVYDNEKAKLSVSERMVKTRDTEGNLITCMWRDTKPGHRHGAAIRKMLKHFLADLWYVWRTYEGLSTAPLYVEAKLGHTGIIRPEQRGWVYLTEKIKKPSKRA